MNIDYTSYLSKAKNFRQRFLVLHYTAGNFSASMRELTNGSVSAHYVIPTINTIDSSYPNKELIVYSLVPEMERAWGDGVSAWSNRTNLNDSSIIIEIINQATDTKFEPYPEQQITLIAELCKNILSRYPDIVPSNVLGHSDISVGRKIDPGPLFPWKTLYDAGVGAWYDQETADSYRSDFDANLPSEQDVFSKLSQYGYAYNGGISTLLKAFQMHFRPTDYSGKLDSETAAIAYALVDKYIT